MNKNNFSSEEKAALQELKDTLSGFIGERFKLILYGSKAREDFDFASDIDIAIIVQGLTRELKNQILDIVAGIELKYLSALSTLVLSEEDFMFLKRRERRIALDIEREGMLL